MENEKPEILRPDKLEGEKLKQAAEKIGTHDLEKMNEKLERSLAHLTELRKSLELKSKEAHSNSTLAGFASTERNLKQIKSEVQSLLGKELTDADVEKIVQLRHRAAEHMNRLRNSRHERVKELSDKKPLVQTPEMQSETIPVIPGLPSLDRKKAGWGKYVKRLALAAAVAFIPTATTDNGSDSVNGFEKVPTVTSSAPALGDTEPSISENDIELSQIEEDAPLSAEFKEGDSLVSPSPEVALADIESQPLPAPKFFTTAPIGEAPSAEDTIRVDVPNVEADSGDANTVDAPSLDSVSSIDSPATYDDSERIPPILFTFEEGSRINTVSEAAFEEWKKHPEYISTHMTKSEFLAHMWTVIAELEKNPTQNQEMMEKAHIDSNDIDKVYVDQTINLRPIFQLIESNV